MSPPPCNHQDRRFRLCVPDVRLVTALSEAGMLELLLAPRLADLVLLDGVLFETASVVASVTRLRRRNPGRITITRTSIGRTLRQCRLHHLPNVLSHAHEKSMLEFIVTALPALANRDPVLILHDGNSLCPGLAAEPELRQSVRLMTVPEYLAHMEANGHIVLFFDTLQRLFREFPDPQRMRHRYRADAELEFDFS